MNDPAFYSQFVDGYVRNRLSGEEESEFELALLGSSELQAELQSVLALREALIQADRNRRFGGGPLGSADRRRA